jgi:hypothetical protein
MVWTSSLFSISAACTMVIVHHYSQHAFIRDDKSGKDLLNIADQDQPFPNFSGDCSGLPGIVNLFQRGELFAG